MLPSKLSCSPEEDIKDKVEEHSCGGSDREGDTLNIQDSGLDKLDKADSLTDIESLEMGSEEASTMEIGNEDDVDVINKEKSELENEVKECVKTISKNLENLPKPRSLKDDKITPEMILPAKDPDIKEVPFFYYVTPKNFKQSKSKLATSSMDVVSGIKEDKYVTKVPFLYYVTPKSLASKKAKLKEDRSNSLEIDDTTYDSVKDFIGSDGEKEGKVPFLFYITPKTMKEGKKFKSTDKDKSPISTDEKKDKSIEKDKDSEPLKSKIDVPKAKLKEKDKKPKLDIKDNSNEKVDDGLFKDKESELKKNKEKIAVTEKEDLPEKTSTADISGKKHSDQESGKENHTKNISDISVNKENIKNDEISELTEAFDCPSNLRVTSDTEKKAKTNKLLIFKRLYHSAEVGSNQDEMIKPSELDNSLASEKPKRLKFHKRSKSERVATPSPIKEVPYVHPKQKRLFFYRLFGSKDLDSQLDSLKRSPSYELALTKAVSLKGPKKPGFTAKIRQLFKIHNDSETEDDLVKITDLDNTKETSAAKVDKNDTHVQDISARHPSISMYIDETPISTSPLTLSSCLAPSASSFVPPCDTVAPLAHPEPSPSPLLPNLTTPPFCRTDSLEPNCSEALSSVSSSSSSTSSSQPVSPDTSAKAPHERKLTFALPFGSAHQQEEEAVKPVERAVEARTQSPDYIGSMVRCLHLTKCYIASSQLMSATLWAGTNSGAVFIFTIAIPPSEKRLEVPLTVQLGKEIHLKHGAPVINTMILDGASSPFPDPMAVKRGAAPSPDTSGPHRVLITSEEQFKVFTLPHLKPYCKFKLTAQEGTRIRKVGVADFVSTADKSYKESCVMIVTNQGDLSVYSLPDCRKQVMAQVIKREDISGINSVVFTKRGEALYLVSASELARISLSAQSVTFPQGKIPIVSKKKTSSPVKEVVNASPKKAESITAPQEEAATEKSPVKEAIQTTPSIKKPEELKENGDLSLLSGDITIDSIRDHINDREEAKTSEKVVELATSSSILTSLAETETETTTGSTAFTTTTVSTIKEESSTKMEGNVTVVKTSNVTITSSQETTSVQVVETSQNEENHAINGTEGMERRKEQEVRKAKEQKSTEEEKSALS